MAYFSSPNKTGLSESRFGVTYLDELEPSFVSPKKRDDLVSQMRSGSNSGSSARHTSLATPGHGRNPLSGRNNPPSKQEFTPLLKSAAKNRVLRKMDLLEQENGIATPEALKPGFKFDSPSFPEATTLSADHTSSSLTGDATPIAKIASSSLIMSTPIPILPKRGEGMMDGGNILTLREQEAVRTNQLLIHNDLQTNRAK